jgi:hypothetical protein
MMKVMIEVLKRFVWQVSRRVFYLSFFKLVGADDATTEAY